MYKDGSSYDGEWIEGYAHGRGTFKSFDGSVYVGSFERGLKVFILLITIIHHLLTAWTRNQEIPGRRPL
jgi:hypothetical protein